MTQSEAKMRILAEWRVWIGHEYEAIAAGANVALKFFEALQQDHPELLSFEHSADDKLRLVKAWLAGAGLIKE